MNQLKDRVKVIGGMGKDPKIKSLEGGKVVDRFHFL